MSSTTNELWFAYSPSSLLAEETEQQYIDMLLRHYHQSLKSNLRALDYASWSLGFDDSNTLEAFNIGFCDRSLPSALPSVRTLDGETIRGVYQRHGLFKPNGRETFRGMIIIPVLDADGRYRGAYGKRIADFPVIKREEAAYSLANGAEGVLFNESALSQYEHVFLCETPFDVVSLHEAKIYNAISLLDFRYFDDEHLSRLMEAGIKSITLAFSRTPQGDRYVSYFRAMLEEVGIKVGKLEGIVGESINSVWAKSLLFDKLKHQIERHQPQGGSPSWTQASHSLKH